MHTRIMSTRRTSPTVKRRRVALTLRELRARAGLKAADVARAVDKDTSWLGRVEKADIYCHPNHVSALLRLYGIEGRQAEAVIEVARQAKQRGWWHRFRDAMPSDFSTFVGLENDATSLRTFENSVIPGLLQTKEYAHSLITASLVKARRTEIDRLVALRMERQALLDIDNGAEFRFVIDEAALRRLVGGQETMVSQIEHLLTVNETYQNVKISVLPLAAGAHAGIDGPFTLLEFEPPPDGYPDTSEPRVAYVETLTGAMYLESPGEISAYAAAWDGLNVAAEPPYRVPELLRTIAGDLQERPTI